MSLAILETRLAHLNYANDDADRNKLEDKVVNRVRSQY